MGMISDLRRLRRQGHDLAAASGRPTTVTGRLAALPGDLRQAADAAEYAATQQRQAAAGPARIEHGLPGTAVIEAFRSTGELVGFQPVGHLDLVVELDGREPYRVTTSIVVPYERLTLMTHGRRVQVLVDPADRARVQICWDA
jgi:hypothetical protein